MRSLAIFLAVGLLLWCLYSSIYLVDRAEFAYVTQFGRHIATFDGVTDAGWHWKLPWPIQAVQRIDHRLQLFDLPPAEMVTPDTRGKTIDKTLTIEAYVCWRIPQAEDVDRFIRHIGTTDRAREILGPWISSRFGAEISNMPLEDLISVADPQQVRERMDRLSRRLLGEGDDGLRAKTRQKYGIEIVDIRLRRFNHPPGVRDSIFDRIRSERNKKAAEYTSEGAQLAANIASAAEKERQDILTEARALEQRLKKEAEIRADEIRNQAHSKDREFYTFLQKLEAYQRILGESKDLLLLSSHHPLFDLLLNPPRMKGPGSPTGTAGTPPPTHDPSRSGGP
ncbi:MAG: protease modulator HflC [Gemmataceae bacterium]|nr:protease modulator HflC [Gemmataceae bacterium]MDW8266591.1 protease modulator HflC [Gemmataceae bacterium]